ncbi:hypothetical protein HS141_11430 [Cetobacterium somerae]|uniref:putative HNHc nuclease n=1 Tax=Cetobacterium somerae TaxID=188913 RepID=UPI00211E2C80|nr:putative HNHc nuclease [Cetobacterium somerae]MCQ9627539.1 hypothetical protein [Cetobacterium somerae]
MYRLVFENDRAILEVNENMSVAELKKLHSKLSKGIEIKKVDTISDEQMKMLWCIFKDLGELIGYTKEELREELENKYCSEKKIEYFSISPNKRNCASKDIATDFIAWIIDWSIHQGYNLILHIGKGPNKKLKSARDICPDISRYIVACLRNKVCAVCGRIEADLHHWDNVNSIGGYEFDDGLKTRFISLCREHHNLFHAIGEKDFENRYHLQGVMLNPSLVFSLKKIYKNHFKAFDEKNYTNIKEQSYGK